MSWFVGGAVGFVACLFTLASGHTNSLSPVRLFAIDANSPACQRIVALGFECSADSFNEAMSSNNVDAIKLLVEGGQGKVSNELNRHEAPALKTFGEAMYRFARQAEFVEPCKTGEDKADAAYGCSVLQENGLSCALLGHREPDPALDATYENWRTKAISHAEEVPNRRLQVSARSAISTGITAQCRSRWQAQTNVHGMQIARPIS